MEYQPKKCKKTRKKDHVNFFHDLVHVCSNCSISSDSEFLLHPLNFAPNKNKKENKASQKRDYLTRIFEKKKLKDKSLSKKMKTPFDRKVNRTCWPIELGKVSKIKKKPQEKKKRKPTHRSLREKKFRNPKYFTFRARPFKRRNSSISSNGSTHFDGDFYHKENNFNTDHFLHEPVTPQMLIDVLQDPEHLKSGATIDMIITKLRTLKLDLNPSEELLREEVFRKLCCAVKLGLVNENNGYYTIAGNVQMPRKKIIAFWESHYRKVRKANT